MKISSEWDDSILLNPFKRILKITGLTFLVLFLFTTGVFATEVLKVAKVTLAAEAMSYQDILSAIERQTDYLFVYEKSEINLDKKVDVNVQDKTVDEVLASIFQHSDITYAMEGNNIMLMRGAKQSSSPTVPRVQQQGRRTITGKVSDSRGEVIIGANIMERGTTNGTVTDIDGNFSLTVSDNAVLRVSYIGFTPSEVPVRNQNTMQIVLHEDTQNLEELVVVGYGVQKKVNLTGSVSTVTYDQELENRPITDVSQALQGKVTGVWATQFSGNPADDGATIRIRGYGGLGAAEPSPLVLIDGIEGKMNELDPNSIESMTVLKDAASAAIYGSRAANGVILIETKKGKGDKVTLTYNGYVGFSQIPGKYDIVTNSAEYMELWNLARANKGNSRIFPEDVIEAFRNGNDKYRYPNTDWQDEIYRKGFQTQHTLSASGGSQASKSFLSMSYMKNDGTMKQTSAERYSLNLNNDTKINNWLTVGARARLQRRASDNPYLINNVHYQIMNGHPYATPYLQDGKTFGASQALYLSGDRAGQEITDTRNPFPELYNGKSRTENNFLRGNVYATASIIEGLTFSVNYSGQYSSRIRDRYNSLNWCYYSLDNPSYTKSLDYDTTLSVERQISEDWYTTFFANLNFNKTFNKIHEFTGVVGYQQEATTRKDTEAKRKNPAKGDLHQVNSGTSNVEGMGNTYQLRMMSYFGRVNYALMSKYLFEVNFRGDGSSRFAKDNRWGYFPSFSVGWRLGEESFIKNLGIFDNFKLRASWGKLGNQNTGSSDNRNYFPYLTVWEQSFEPGQAGTNNTSYNFNNTLAPGAAITALVDPNITWETTTTTDIGLDLGFLNNRLSFEGDYFHRKTEDILVRLPLPYIMGGVSAPYENIGEVINKGVEMNLTWQDRIQGTDFSYRVGVNLTIIDNKVTKFQGGKSPDQTYLIREGYSYNELYGYIMEGIYQSDEEAKAHMHANSYKPTAGELKYKDFNGDGKLDAADKRSMGRSIPKYTFGLNTNLTWKSFDLNLAFAGNAGYNLYNNSSWTQPLAASGGPIPVRWRDSWTAENKSTTVPKIMVGDTWLRQAGSFWVVDNMWWLKLKNVQLGYLVPTASVKKIGLQKLYVYANVSEVFCLKPSKFEGYDPERDTFSSGNNQYPVSQTFTLGMNITF